MDFKFGLLNFIFMLDSVGSFLYENFLLVPGDFLLSLEGLYTLSVLFLPPVSSMASSSIASSIRSIWFTPLGNGIDVLDVYDQLRMCVMYTVHETIKLLVAHTVNKTHNHNNIYYTYT